MIQNYSCKKFKVCREAHVARKDSTVKQHILATAVAMISDQGSDKVRIADLARRASVGVPTIYYHFDSRSKLLAEAQVLRYEESMRPLRDILIEVEAAVGRRDEPEFWRAIHEFVSSVWDPARAVDRFEVGKWLMDESADSFMRERFLEIMDEQYQRWLGVVRSAQDLGWISTLAPIVHENSVERSMRIFANSLSRSPSIEPLFEFRAGSCRDFGNGFRPVGRVQPRGGDSGQR